MSDRNQGIALGTILAAMGTFIMEDANTWSWHGAAYIILGAALIIISLKSNDE